MLSILDRYIIRKFLTTFFFVMGVVMVLSMVFDLSERLNDFIDNEAPIGAILIDYYLNFVIYYGNLFSSLIIFISVIWFTAKLAQNSEIIPMLNSGRPFTRLLRPYMIAATILTIISLGLNHFVLPKANKARLEFEEEYYRTRLGIENYHADIPPNQTIYFANYNSDHGQITEFNYERWQGDSLIYHLRSKKAVNKPGTTDWKLMDYTERYVGLDQDRIVEGKEKDTVFAFDISEFAKRHNVAEAMNYTELEEFIKRERIKGSAEVPSYEIQKHERTAYPFATYVLTLIGVAVSSRKSRGGIGVHIATGLAIVFVYIFAMKVTTVAATNVGLAPAIAVWIPNVLFGIFGLILYRFAPK